MRSQRKGSTNVFETYITAQCINARSRLNLAVLHVTQHSINADSVRKLVECVHGAGVKPSLILLDREFYSTDVIRTLDFWNAMPDSVHRHKSNQEGLGTPCIHRLQKSLQDEHLKS